VSAFMLGNYTSEFIPTVVSYFTTCRNPWFILGEGGDQTLCAVAQIACDDFWPAESFTIELNDPLYKHVSTPFWCGCSLLTSPSGPSASHGCTA
jgi:hypothetical protein